MKFNFLWMIVPAMILWFESRVVHAEETSPDSEPTLSTHHLTKAVNKTLPMIVEIIFVAKPMVVKKTADSPNAIEQPPTAVHTDKVQPATPSPSTSPSSALETRTIMTAPTLVSMQMHMQNGHQRRVGIVMGGLAAGVVALVVSSMIILFCRRTRRGAEDEDTYYKNDGMDDEYDDLEAQRESPSQDRSTDPPAYHIQDLVFAMNIGIIFPQSTRSSVSAPPAYVEPPSYGDAVAVAR